MYVPTAAEGHEEMAEAVSSLSPEYSIPIIAYFDGEGSMEATKEVSKHVPCVTSSKNVAKAISALKERISFLRNR